MGVCTGAATARGIVIVDECPRGLGRAKAASSLVDSERCLPDGHVWPEIIIRLDDRQDWGDARENPGCRSRSGVTIAHHSIFCEIGLGMPTTKITAALRKRLLRSARKVMNNAYAPFSKFRVGAAILTSKGRVFVGCNIENSSYGMTNCAERTAIFSAVAQRGPEIEIKAVAVVNNHNAKCSPCGACRQVIYEFGPRAVIFYEGKRGPKQSLITELLPEGFRLK